MEGIVIGRQTEEFQDDSYDEDDRWVADRIGVGPLTEIQGSWTPEERDGRTWLIRP
jgi:hypothetical protein